MNAPAPAPTPPPPDDLRVAADRTALVLVDVQSKLSAVMPQAPMAALERNVLILIELAKRQRWPILWSEQYTKGLGPTIESLASALADPALQVHRIEKMTFACTDDPGFAAAVTALDRSSFVVVGMEAHVCVWQTARGLRSAGHQVFIPQDAVVSRHADNRQVGLALADRAGAVLTSTEVVVFDALGKAGTDDFRALSKMLK